MTAPDVNADVRARFEAWARRKGLDVTRWNERKRGVLPNEYMKLDTDMAWAGYLMAHADMAGEVRELVEADLEYDTARSRYSAAFRDGPNGDLNEQRLAQKHLNDAKARRSAALAKFHPTQQEKP